MKKENFTHAARLTNWLKAFNPTANFRWNGKADFLASIRAEIPALNLRPMEIDEYVKSLPSVREANRRITDMMQRGGVNPYACHYSNNSESAESWEATRREQVLARINAEI